MDKFKQIVGPGLSLEEQEELMNLEEELDRKIITKKQYERDFADGKHDEYLAATMKDREAMEKRAEELYAKEMGRYSKR